MKKVALNSILFSDKKSSNYLANNWKAITKAYKAQASAKAAPTRKNPTALPATSG